MRQPRQLKIGSVYHIIQRGIEKRRIFMKPQDYSRFTLGLEFFNREGFNDIWDLIVKGGSVPPLERIKAERAKKRRSLVELMAFVLMPNHFHLIIREIKRNGTALFMKKMGGYSTYFNKQYKRVGPLFQSRYKAIEVRTEDQLGNLFVYVHTNPVELHDSKWKEFKVENKGNAINWLESYKWSSYHDYTGARMFPEITDRDFFLNFYGGGRNCRKAVEDWISFKAENAELDLKYLE